MPSAAGFCEGEIDAAAAGAAIIAPYGCWLVSGPAGLQGRLVIDATSFIPQELEL
jgi:hypothetical protein